MTDFHSADQQLAKELRQIMARTAVIWQTLNDAGWTVSICVDTRKNPYLGSCQIYRKQEL